MVHHRHRRAVCKQTKTNQKVNKVEIKLKKLLYIWILDSDKMVICCVIGCHNRPEWKRQNFYYVPRIRVKHGEDSEILSTERRKKWFAAIRRSDLNQEANHHRVCSDHFVSGKASALFETSHVDWVPSLKMGYGNEEEATSRSFAAIDRVKRRQERKRKLNDSMVSNPEPPTIDASPPKSTPATEEEQSFYDFTIERMEPCSSRSSGNTHTDHDHIIDIPPYAKKIQTDMTSNDISILEQGMNDLSSALHNLNIEKKSKVVGTKAWFDKDQKVSFYTGVPNFYVLSTIFYFVSSNITHSSNSCLTQFQEFAMTLIRFRLNLTLQDLAYRFEVSVSTTSTIILKWIDILFIRLRLLIKWPSREDLITTTPMSFRQHFKTKVAVIIDCFEIFCNQPKNLSARAQTFSSYKHHNTIKILIGITPQGVISFVSKSWGGRTSDRHLTENCGLLKNLLPGDVILADRGFDIGDFAAVVGATVEIPAFTKGKKQLCAFDVERSRKLASVRVHVERVIGLLRNKYTILKDILPLDYLMRKDDTDYTTIDKIVIICSALTNVCDSVIPVE